MSTITILYSLLVGIIALAIAVFQYNNKAKGKLRFNLLFAFLRFLSLFFIGLLIVNPKFKKRSYTVDKPNLIVLTDNSKSVKYLQKDAAVKDFVNQLEENIELNNKFDIANYSFGSELNSTDSLSFSDIQSNIAKALAQANEIYKDENTAFVLLTDGNQTYGTDYQFESRKIKHPIFPVIVGDTLRYADLKISQLNVNKYAFLNNQYPIEVLVNYQGEGLIKAAVKIKRGNTILKSKEVEFTAANRANLVNFLLTANKVGVQRYTIELDILSDEKNTSNNKREFAIEVLDEKTKVLIVSNLVHPDIGALKKAISANDQRTVSLAKPSLNGVDLTQYNMVILYQPNSAFRSVYKQLNKLGKSRWVITGTKTDWRFLNAIQNNYSKNPNGQREELLAAKNNNYNVFIVNNQELENYPPLQGVFGDIIIKQKLDIILYQRIGSVLTENPLLATFETDQNVREAVLFGEDIWKWRAQSYLDNDKFETFDSFLSKIVQYLSTSKKKNRLVVDFQTFYDSNSDNIIRAQYFNKNYEFDASATLMLKLKDSAGSAPQSIPLLLKNGSYEIDLSKLKAGDYDFTISVEGENLSRSGSFKMLDFDVEQQYVNANVTKLQEVATNTKGTAFYLDQNTQIINSLLADNRFVSVQKGSEKVIPLIDWKYLLALIVLSLAIEWFLRKYNGLI
jgi:hypothetical protein